MREIEDIRENYKNDLKGHQYVTLRILRIVDEICRKNNIKYWLDSGTLLGAVRHKGFIPWDDDIDIGILREDEEKFINVMKKELPKELFLQTKETDKFAKFEYIKIRDKYSSIELEEKTGWHSGIWIDIFIFDKTKKHIILDKIIRKLPMEISKTEEGIKKYIKEIILSTFKFLKINDIREVKKKLYVYFSKNIKKNNSVIYYNGIDYWITYYIKDIFPLSEIEFEGYKFFCPNNVNAILKELYGKDYMKLPPKEKRFTHSIGVNLTKPCNHKEILYWDKRKENEDD